MRAILVLGALLPLAGCAGPPEPSQEEAPQGWSIFEELGSEETRALARTPGFDADVELRASYPYVHGVFFAPLLQGKSYTMGWAPGSNAEGSASWGTLLQWSCRPGEAEPDAVDWAELTLERDEERCIATLTPRVDLIDEGNGPDARELRLAWKSPVAGPLRFSASVEG